MKKIGFIGLGHMGTPMVENLLKQDFDVTVFDLVDESVQRLVAKGAKPASSISELAKTSEVFITMLQTGQQVKSVCLGPDGLFENVESSAFIIDSSSIDVDSSRELHQIARESGFSMLDAPVSGGVAGAQAAALTIMVGGEAEDFEKALPIFNCLGKKVVHAGAAGNGQVAKICNNMILGISMIAVSEGFSLGEKLGLSPEKLFEISANASGQCWAMTSYSPVPGLVENVPSNNDYQAGFTAAMMLKDLELSQNAAKSVNLHTHVGELATLLYTLFVNCDNADVDFSGIINLLKQEGFE